MAEVSGSEVYRRRRGLAEIHSKSHRRLESICLRILLSIFLSTCPLLCLAFCLFCLLCVGLRIYHDLSWLSIDLFVYVYLILSHLSLCIYPSIYPSIHLSICPSICPSIHLSTVYLSIYLVCLPVCQINLSIQSVYTPPSLSLFLDISLSFPSLLTSCSNFPWVRRLTCKHLQTSMNEHFHLTCSHMPRLKLRGHDKALQDISYCRVRI